VIVIDRRSTCHRTTCSVGGTAPHDHVTTSGRAAHLEPAQVRDVAALARAALGPHGLDGKHATPLLGQLGARLRVRVEESEVGDDDRNRKCYGEHAGERAKRPDEHADVRLGRHVAVANRCHGDDGPPQPDRDGGEEGLSQYVTRSLTQSQSALLQRDGEMQTNRDGGEVVGRVVLDALGVVDERREDDDAEHEKEDE